MARAAQESVEEIMVHLAKLALEKTGLRNLCIAGGVGLNCVANSRIRTDLGIENIFVQPASTDDGAALGAALYGWQQLQQKIPTWSCWSSALGRLYSEEDTFLALQKFDLHLGRGQYEVKNKVGLETVAHLIAEGHVVGWFNGRSEFGPRALGHRSLLADPRATGMRSHLTAKSKDANTTDHTVQVFFQISRSIFRLNSRRTLYAFRL